MLPSVGSLDTMTASSIFNDHLLAPKAPKPVIHYTDYDYLIASVLLFMYIIFVMLYIKNRKRLNQVIKAFYINRFASQLVREEVSVVNRVSILLSIIFLFSITIFIRQIMDYYGWSQEQNEMLLFLFILASVIIVYTVKFITIKFFGFVFKTAKETDEYALTVLLYINSLGLFLLPIVVCIAFAENVPVEIFIKTGLCLLALFLFTRMVRGLIIGLNSIRVSKFYLFLYLCSLEILPLIVMVKIFIRSTLS